MQSLAEVPRLAPQLSQASMAQVLALIPVASLEELVDFRDQFEALRYRAGQIETNGQMFRFFAEAKLRAERRAGQLLAEMNLGPGPAGVSDTLSLTGIERHQSSRWQRIASIPDLDFETYIADAAELTTAGALKLAKRATVKTAPPHTYDTLETIPDLFTSIVIDPPWRYDNTATRAAAEDHYATMGQSDLLSMEIPAGADAHLYLWVTNSFIGDGLELCAKWGFTYKTMLTWCKPQIGMGNYFRSATEHVLFGVRGRLPTQRKDVSTWFVADRKAHSAKPESFYDLVEACSPGPYLEMFARRRRFGWHVQGFES